MTLYTWSKIASANATADATINWAEGQSPSSVNDSARATMAAVAKARDDASGSLTTAGISTAYTVTSNQVFDTLAHLDGQSLCIVPHTTSGVSPTLNVDGLGAKPIRASTGVSAATGALVQGTPYRLTYYNTAGEFILEGGVAAIPGNLSIGGTLAVTGATTLSSTLSVSGAATLGIGVTTRGDANYTILATDGAVVTNAAFTLSRTFTLPAANAVKPGQRIIVSDEANGITSTNTLVLSRAGTDTIVAQGTTVTSITLQSAGDAIAVISDGVSKWLVDGIRKLPTVQRFTSGSAQTYTPAVGVSAIRVRMVGGGGGGGAQATNNGAAGTDTSFNVWTAKAGNGGANGGAAAGQGAAGGTGGANGTGTLIARFDGQAGAGIQTSPLSGMGQPGGNSVFGGAGVYHNNTAAGSSAAANTGSGGAGGTSNGAGAGGGGGGAGEYVEFWVNNPGNTTYTVGSGGNGGAAGTQAGGNGAAGVIIIEEFYS
jgi:hypothetical protein